MRRRHISERTADIVLGIILILACVGIFAITKWTVAFIAALLSAAMF